MDSSKCGRKVEATFSVTRETMFFPDAYQLKFNQSLFI